MSGSCVYWISQARILVYVAISYSRGSPHPGMEPKSTKSLALAGRFFLSLHHLGSPSKEDRHPNPQCRSGVANNNRCPYAGCIICTTLYEELHSLSLFNIWHKTGRQPPKNWYFWIVVLEKTLENPLDSKEIKPINCKGNQPWIVIEGQMLRLKLQCLATWC